MKTLIKTITGVPDGEIYPRKIAAGEECPPALVTYARSVGALRTDDDAPPSGGVDQTGDVSPAPGDLDGDASQVEPDTTDQNGDADVSAADDGTDDTSDAGQAATDGDASQSEPDAVAEVKRGRK